MGDETLLERILNGDEEPKDLPLPLLQSITNHFSHDRKIGQGGFGAVYKGELQNGIIVAVKRIEVNQITIDDVSFRREFNSLMNTDHQNVVRFLGFCSNTHHTSRKEAGEINLVSVRERLLCFEYIRNGSLDKHITDELRGLEWEPRYAIISGICKGLFYLHEQKKIVHMDLKPPNILLDDHKVPKITDFGLSRSNDKSHTMGHRFGTAGYIAPEYEKDGKTSFKCDIYSLGVIITELATGCKTVPDKNNVLRRWRHRWNKSPTLLQYQQVTSCINIAVRCREQKPEDRPSIGDIMSILSESVSTDWHTGQESTYLDDDILGIEPLELQFSLMLDTEMSCSVKLTNKTKACFAFNIERPSQQYTIRPDKGIVPPEWNEFLVKITLQPQERAPEVTGNADKFTVQSTKVSEDLRVEDITEHIFHEEAGKVVDEVDLMVVYGKGSGRRGPVCPFVEGVTVKPCQAINSISYEDGTRGQLGRRNFRPPKNFSRTQPANMTYLLRVSDRAIDVTRGAMGCLLHKLGVLLKEFNLETSVKEDVDSHSKELVKMQLVLRKVSQVQQDNLDDLVKRWASNVREMSYDLEDFVDGFLVQSEPESNTSGFRELTHEMCFLLEKGKGHQPIGDLIKHHISKQVQDEDKKCKEYNVDNVVDDTAATVTDTIDPRNLVVFQRPKELVGIEEPRDNLIKRLSQVSEQQLRIFSIYGAGGSGKTTLAKAVYDKLEGQFHPMAFVSVGRNPDKKQVLRDIIDELSIDSNTATLNEKQLIKELHKLLKNKRYFIVIDDIWDSSTWGIIEYSFPENNHGSRVVTTTRIHSVAVACCNIKYVYEMGTLNNLDSRRLFVSRIFGTEDACPDAPEDILTAILKKCGGLPLAIISIASLLAKKDPSRRSTWDYVSKSLIAMFEGDNPTHTDMEQILDLSYIHLPNHLKTCLLSVGKYREDEEIEKVDLLRQWIAEGFVVSTTRGLDAEDVAENYFNELINMSMIQPGKIDDFNNEMTSCRVHDIVLDLLRSKSKKENFSHVIDGSKDGTWAPGKIRRISVQYNDEDDNAVFETIKGSLLHARSALLYQVSAVPYLLVFKYVRVLQIKCELNCMDLSGINRLFLLRYLKIEGGHVLLKLPNQIGELQQLETIDIDGGKQENLPSDIASLPRLSHLACRGYYGDGTALPEGVERLKSLRTLESIDLYNSSVENIKGLGKLTNLRTLKILLDFMKTKQEVNVTMDALLSSISLLSANLRILTLRDKHRFSGDYVDVPPGWSSRTALFPGGSNITELELGSWRFERCPGCISELHNLHKFSIMVREVADDLSIVAWLPSLAYFRLETPGDSEEQKEESVVIPGSGAFKALKELVFHCPKAALTFAPRAVPKLEKLHLQFANEMTPQLVPAGIQHLPALNLKEIWLLVNQASVEEELRRSAFQDWEDDLSEYWEDYECSDERRDKQTKNDRKLNAMLKKAFKQHHPGADIRVSFDWMPQEYLEEYINEEYCSTEEDDEAAYQVNISQTSAQHHADHTRQLVELIEAQKDSGEMSITTEATTVVDTSLHLAVGSEVQQRGWGDDFSVDNHIEDCSNEEADKAVHQENESQTSEQASADTRKFVQLIEEQKVSGTRLLAQVSADTRQFVQLMEGTQTEVPLNLMVDTSLHLALGSEGQQVGNGEGFNVLESLQPSSPSSLDLLTLALASPLHCIPPSPNLPVSINTDMLVQQGNNDMLVTGGD